MKNFTKNITTLILLVVVFFVFRSSINREYQNIKDQLLPCSFPITYSLGTVDNRFGLSKGEFLQSINEAVGIWGGAVGKKLFTYDEASGDLKINLVYDNRQATTTVLGSLDKNLNGSKNTYDSLKAQYDILKNEIDNSRSNIQNENDVVIFNQKVSELNNLANEINQLARNINSEVSTYNTIGGSLGNEFEEGLYYSNKNGRRIDIYQFKDKNTLVRLLAHELGHALSLEHTNNPNDIMYRINEGSSLKLTTNDISAIKAHCKVK